MRRASSDGVAENGRLEQFDFAQWHAAVEGQAEVVVPRPGAEIRVGVFDLLQGVDPGGVDLHQEDQVRVGRAEIVEHGRLVGIGGVYVEADDPQGRGGRQGECAVAARAREFERVGGQGQQAGQQHEAGSFERQAPGDSDQADHEVLPAEVTEEVETPVPAPEEPEPGATECEQQGDVDESAQADAGGEEAAVAGGHR